MDILVQALDYTLPQSTSNPSGLIEALAAARGTSTVTDPQALPPLANATFNALRDAIISGQGPSILELVDPSAPLSPTNRAVLSTLATVSGPGACRQARVGCVKPALPARQHPRAVSQ